MKIKTFRVACEADEKAVDAFLANVCVAEHHCSHALDGSWAVLFLYEDVAVASARPADTVRPSVAARPIAPARPSVPEPHPKPHAGLRNGPFTAFENGPHVVPERHAGLQNGPHPVSENEPQPGEDSDGPAAIVLSPAQTERFEALRRWRNERAAQEGCKPYVIASNRDLTLVACTDVATPGDLLSLRGFGLRRTQLYGEEIVAVLDSVTEQ